MTSTPEHPGYSIAFHGDSQVFQLSDYGRRLHQWLCGLGEWDPSLANWHHQGNSFREALKRRMDTSAAGLTSQLTQEFERERRRFRRENAVTFSAWVPAPDLSKGGGAVTYVTMGVLPGWNPSACSLELDTEGESGRRMFQTSKLIELCALGARCWDLEYGFVCECNHMMDQSNRRGPKKRWTGWMIYFSHRLGALPSLPAPTRIVPIDDLGNVIVITEEPFRFDNPEHVERAEQVFKALDHAGLMDAPP